MISGILDGRYRVDRRVGEGGFGEVYAAFHLALGAPVAIKVLRIGEGLAPDKRAELVTRFLEEGRILTRLRHPNIVAALDLGVFNGQEPYLVMEWAPGETLKSVLAARPRLSLAEAWALFEPLCEGLAHAHAAGVVHRDLKPANVMVVDARVPRIIDFGVAKLVAPDDVAGSGWTETTGTSASAFTPAYAAPEQVTLSRTGPWTDVHALALLFVELLTGAPPYGKGDNLRIAAVDPVRPSPRAAGIDVGPLEPVLAKALALRPADRYANAGELLAAARQAMKVPSPRVALAPPQPTDTAAPASRTLPAGASARVSRRPIVGVSILATLGVAALGAGAFAIVPRLGARAAGSPLPSTSAPPLTTAATTLSSITPAELTERVRRAGVSENVNSYASGGSVRVVQAVWQGRGAPESWQVAITPLSSYGAPEHPSDAARKAAVDSAIATYRGTGLGFAYGADGDSFAVVTTSAKDGSEPLFASVFKDIDLVDRGEVPSPRALRDASAPAKRVRDLSPEELESRLRAKGTVVTMTWGGAWDSSVTTFNLVGAGGMANIYRKDARAVVESFKLQRQSAAYAIDGDTLVIVTGDASFTTKKFLSDVLAGLGATVVELRPSL